MPASPSAGKCSKATSKLGAILSTDAWLERTLFFVPPNDTVLGAGAGPHLEVSAVPGLLGARSFRDDAIEALVSLAPPVPLNELKRDKAGALLRLTPNRSVGFYYALQIEKRFSLLSSAGSNLHLDIDRLKQEIQRFLGERLEASGV